MKKPSRLAKCILFPLAGLAFLALLSAVVMLLWNGVLAEVVAVKTINFWQAAGLLILSKILFGGFGRKRGRFGPPWRDRMVQMRLQEQWHAMSPEEREKIRDEMKQRFGAWPRPWCCGPDEHDDVGFERGAGGEAKSNRDAGDAP